jgi:hypothetical protein
MPFVNEHCRNFNACKHFSKFDSKDNERRKNIRLFVKINFEVNQLPTVEPGFKRFFIIAFSSADK